MIGVKEQVVLELHKPARRNFKRRHTLIKGFDDLWQADLMELLPYAKINKGYKYVLVVIDCYSKFVWTRPLKSKTGPETSKAVEDIFKQGRVPKNLQTDRGKEFYNVHWSKIMNAYRVNHYSTYSVKKAAIAERVIRTLKTLLYRAFSLRGKHLWMDILNEVTNTYNNRIHSTTKMKPSDVRPETNLGCFSHHKIMDKQKYKEGDVVRISKYKSQFAKGYTPNWSSELFKIYKVQLTNPTTYLLKDMSGQPILGAFYTQELQNAKYSDVYLVEKVLKRNKRNLYVKWLGLDNSHNSWINKHNVFS